jgi:hypothetical protein
VRCNKVNSKGRLTGVKRVRDERVHELVGPKFKISVTYTGLGKSAPSPPIACATPEKIKNHAGCDGRVGHKFEKESTECPWLQFCQITEKDNRHSPLAASGLILLSRLSSMMNGSRNLDDSVQAASNKTLVTNR